MFAELRLKNTGIDFSLLYYFGNLSLLFALIFKLTFSPLCALMSFTYAHLKHLSQYNWIRQIKIILIMEVFTSTSFLKVFEDFCFQAFKDLME